MPSRSFRRAGETSQSVQQQLPFTGDAAEDTDFSRERTAYPDQISNNGHGASGPIRVPSSASNSILSSSYSQRTPARSFFHGASHASSDIPQYSSHGVRERTQELASYALDSDNFRERQSRGRSYTDSETTSPARTGRIPYDAERTSFDSSSDAIEEVSEPVSPETVGPSSHTRTHSPFIPTRQQLNDIEDSRDDLRHNYGSIKSSDEPQVVVQDAEAYGNSEVSPLLPKARLPRTAPEPQDSYKKSSGADGSRSPKIGIRVGEIFSIGRNRAAHAWRAALNPKNYTKDTALHNATASIQMLSAVFLGLLLNVLDALSYGYILFPLGNPIFSNTGPDGISIFFVSCIVSQLCYSLGLSIFKGGVGSEMIEVVPFFHKMAFSIIGKMKGQSSEAIIATVIVSYCLSSVVTGVIFLALGFFKLGKLVSFFPRHILIGCIGGVGFFLVVTGIEVSARLDGNLNYNFHTLRKLFDKDTIMLWLLPLMLSILILVLRRLNKKPYVLPGFFVAVFAIFYILVKGILKRDLANVRNAGWIFEQPEADVPFYRFYSYFNFKLVDGAALASTIPAMFALSFFGIIHVPINVPALGVAVKEDNVSVNRELIAHGISNTLSGLVGSIQNYLVYANSILFINNGGDSRAAGVLLAIATGAVWVAGPAMIGFIPVCIVGALIFMLGIELLEEAVWDTWGKLSRLEYLTIIAIVLIMGVYDFVVGIFIGIVLACLNFVVQSSQTSAVRASYSGEIAESTVRRPRTDRRYLNQVRRQIRVIKLSGCLFFGTIVAVEEHTRSLIEEENFKKQPMSFIVVDFSHVTDIDFSSAEGFQRINRILCRKNVKLVLSGVSFVSRPGRALFNVGLLDEEKGDQDCPPPRVFEDLNTALEACENELLEAFYNHRSSAKRRQTPPLSITSESLSSSDTGRRSAGVPLPPNSLRTDPMDPEFSSPRRGAQILAAATIMNEHGDASINENETIVPSKWKNFAQPIKIMLQTFEDVSDRNEDFWHLAAPYFERKEYPAGTVLYSRGDEPDGFYILEKGRFRAEYELDQGGYYEVILPGTTCGELPFFSQTDRTATVAAENDSIAWLLTREKFIELEQKHPDVARELLKLGLKMTKERMDAITSYVLVTAS